MRFIHWTLPLMGCLVFLGCGGGGVEVDTPDVNVKVNKEDGVEVEAPGVGVKVNKEDGVDVTTPEVDVESAPEDEN